MTGDSTTAGPKTVSQGAAAWANSISPLPAPHLYKFLICRLLESAAMKGLKLLFPAVLVVLTLMVQAQQAPQSKPNLTGKWVFNAQKSSLKMVAPTSMTLQIEQNDPQIRFARVQVYGDQTFKWGLDTVADGQKEVVQDTPQYTAKVRVFWEGGSLVLNQQITAPDGTQATDIVTYTLVEDGRLLQGIEQQTFVGAKGTVTNKWLYDRQPQ